MSQSQRGQARTLASGGARVYRNVCVLTQTRVHMHVFTQTLACPYTLHKPTPSDFAVVTVTHIDPRPRDLCADQVSFRKQSS